MEEVASDLFRVKMPLPTLKFLNVYIIRGIHRHLIIDTGLDSPECLDAMEANLRRLGIALKDTDFFITHFHRDHSGLLFRLAGERSRVYFNKPESRMIASFNFFDRVAAYNLKNGFPEHRLRAMMNRMPKRMPEVAFEHPLRMIGEGDHLSVRDYRFTCLETPGHSPGHRCLYEPKRKMLVAGDLLFEDVAPGIPCISDQGNPLKDYFESLDKVGKLDVDLVLPGHRKLFRGHRKRIRETKQFHFDRLEDLLNILEKGPLTAFQVTSKLLGGVGSEALEKGSGQHLMLEVNQVIAQLRYLEKEGMAAGSPTGGVVAYGLRPGA